MKKTIIALMALTGVAFATPAEDVTNAILTSGYKAGDSFTLTFTIDSTSFNGYVTAPVITLAPSWNINSQAGTYLGFSDATDGVDGSLTTSAATYSSGNTSEVKGTINVGDEGWFYQVNGLNTLTFTITESMLTMTKGNSTVATLEIADGLTASNITLGSNITGISGLSMTTTPAPSDSVPEPTTATLSLLALAGLAARRRRK